MTQEFDYILLVGIPKFSDLNVDNCLWQMVKANNLSGSWLDVHEFNNVDLRLRRNYGTDVIMANVDYQIIESLVNLNGGLHFEGSFAVETEHYNYVYFKKNEFFAMLLCNHELSLV